jgi:hypothetical protein
MGNGEHNCECCLEMKDEITRLRDEVVELRRLLKGKGRVTSVVFE